MNLQTEINNAVKNATSVINYLEYTGRVPIVSTCKNFNITCDRERIEVKKHFFKIPIFITNLNTMKDECPRICVYDRNKEKVLHYVQKAYCN